ncbi:MAG: aspartate kinase [Planctomycetaceae bacterium]
MSLIVQKFGGTSVATAEKIRAAAARAVAARRAGHDVVVVVSARGKKTDELLSLAAEVAKNPSPREIDMLLSTGEQESVALMAMAVHELGESAVSLTGGQIGIATDSLHSKARIKQISTDRLRAHLAEGRIVIACGFQGVDDEGNITTLGRGGSDTTATALAAVLSADECHIYTDVEGVFTTDPRIVAAARKVETLSYDEMLELASLGAGVMHSRSIEFAKKFRVPLRVRPAYSDDPGTLIAPHGDEAAPLVTGLALVRKEARVTLCDLPDRPGVMSVVFAKLSERKIPVDMVVQNIGTAEKAEVSFTVPEDDLAGALTACGAAIRELGAGSVHSGTNVAKVSAVGEGMKSHSGVAAEMFRSLADAGVNIEMITTGDIKVSVLVNRDMAEQALAAVHRGFLLHEASTRGPSIGFLQHRPRTNGTNSAAIEAEVVGSLANMEELVVSDIQLDESQSRITIRNIPDQPGVSADLFEAVAEGDVMVDMIVQNISRQGQAEVSFTVQREDVDRCLLLVREIVSQWGGAQLSHDRAIDKLTVAGIGLRSHTNVGETMFEALADADVNVQMINTSEVRLAVVVAAGRGQDALRCLTTAFAVSGS